MSLIVGREQGMLTELIECFLAQMSLKKEDCAFDKMTFSYRKHLLASKCCFPAKRIPQNTIVLFFGQKSKSFGVLAINFKDSTRKKKKVFFSKNQETQIFFDSF